ncbi:hypothetical protein M9H77_03634 [Catharanthus roseus]|uniref:Uncharacterized protein n=1 Tax=Catharanthus roseus TaxID=4058 RepID=A0ACC0CC96_CATRO|nr:hypothetical protein M9H77_03634 [Catharanthus roseus]
MNLLMVRPVRPLGLENHLLSLKEKKITLVKSNNLEAERKFPKTSVGVAGNACAISSASIKGQAATGEVSSPMAQRRECVPPPSLMNDDDEKAKKEGRPLSHMGYGPFSVVSTMYQCFLFP